LGMRSGACKLHRCESGRGKQHKTKFGHGGLVSPKVPKAGDERTSVRLDCGGVQTRNWIYLSLKTRKNTPVHGVFRAQFVPARSVAGFGVVGLFGPRPGNSSGIFPGSSCGRAGSPGSCIGGGISGRGLPGGSSRGGSVGWPGVGAGISGGSIGIVSLFLPQGDNEGYDAGFHQGSPARRMRMLESNH